MNKLFVGSLPFRMTDEELHQLFAQVGPVVSAKIIIDRATGRSKGFGFVEMENESDVAKAIEQLNGSEVDGRTIVVNEARPEAPRR
ncbi:MAG: RNA-binding protein [Candidatus Dojkabacteria bacterium]|nr:MAG: RNA-binding protein [Candidatus Dojkabacteria bacterium]